MRNYHVCCMLDDWRLHCDHAEVLGYEEPVNISLPYLMDHVTTCTVRATCLTDCSKRNRVAGCSLEIMSMQASGFDSVSTPSWALPFCKKATEFAVNAELPICLQLCPLISENLQRLEALLTALQWHFQLRTFLPKSIPCSHSEQRAG